MSSRTASANKAIAKAWENEQQLIQQGKGTRDWTPEQQRDILETGKAHDADGRSFEGHHMQSVAKYPESQGDPDNIQFLTRDEHRAAHGGSFLNPTNGYYNPSDGKTTEFGDDRFNRCPMLVLTEPIVRIASEESAKEQADRQSQTSIPQDALTTKKKVGTITKAKRTIPKPNFPAIGGWIKNTLKNPVVQETLQEIFIWAIGSLADACISKISKEKSSDYESSSHTSKQISHTTDVPFSSISDLKSSDNIAPDELFSNTANSNTVGSSKQPHLRRGHNSHYWVGPKNGNRTREERWIDDINVNGYQEIDDDEDE